MNIDFAAYEEDTDQCFDFETDQIEFMSKHTGKEFIIVIVDPKTNKTIYKGTLQRIENEK